MTPAHATGRLPDLVLVHGLGSAASFWDNVVGSLATAYTVTAVDLPGHGPGAGDLSSDEASPTALAAAVIEQLRAAGIERPHVVGLSLGGWVALEMAARGAAASVVALAPAGLWQPGSRIPLERRGTLVRPLLGIVDPALPFIFRLPLLRRAALSTTVADPSVVTDAQLVAAARALRQARGYGVCDRACVTRHFEAKEAVGVPTTVVFGDRDRVLPAGTCQERSLVPEHSRWEVLARCGHAVSWDHPAATVALVRETAVVA